MRFLWFMVHLFQDKCESVAITKNQHVQKGYLAHKHEYFSWGEKK